MATCTNRVPQKTGLAISNLRVTLSAVVSLDDGSVISVKIEDQALGRRQLWSSIILRNGWLSS